MSNSASRTGAIVAHPPSGCQVTEAASRRSLSSALAVRQLDALVPADLDGEIARELHGLARGQLLLGRAVGHGRDRRVIAGDLGARDQELRRGAAIAEAAHVVERERAVVQRLGLVPLR